MIESKLDETKREKKIKDVRYDVLVNKSQLQQ